MVYNTIEFTFSSVLIFSDPEPIKLNEDASRLKQLKLTDSIVLPGTELLICQNCRGQTKLINQVKHKIASVFCQKYETDSHQTTMSKWNK